MQVVARSSSSGEYLLEHQKEGRIQVSGNADHLKFTTVTAILGPENLLLPEMTLQRSYSNLNEILF